MTYIIRDDNKAFKLNPGATYDIQFDESKHSYFVTMDDERVSPYFDVLEPNEIREDLTDEEYEEIDAITESDVVNWLCDFLERLDKNPAVMQCTIDGEIFLYPVSSLRKI